MKKILFLINTLNCGGAEKVLVDLVNSLNKEKYNITIQTITDDEIYRKNLNSHINYKSIIRLKNKLLKRIFLKLINSFIPPQIIHRIFIKECYDYEIAFLEGLPTKIISESKNKNAKKIAWVHEILPGKSVVIPSFKNSFDEYNSYKKFDHIVCVSEDSKKSFLERYNNKFDNVEVLYNIFDTENIINMADEEATLKSEYSPCFISVGRLEEIKGYSRLLKVHKRLISEGFYHTLIIIGDGSLKDELLRYISDNNLNSSVVMPGFQKNPYKYIKKCDLFICSSYNEGYGMAISEAAFLGVPVLSTDVYGIREPKECPRCDIIVENSENGLYNGLKNLLENPDKLEEAKRSALNKKQYFSTNALILKVENFLDNI